MTKMVSIDSFKKFKIQCARVSLFSTSIVEAFNCSQLGHYGELEKEWEALKGETVSPEGLIGAMDSIEFEQITEVEQAWCLRAADFLQMCFNSMSGKDLGVKPLKEEYDAVVDILINQKGREALEKRRAMRQTRDMIVALRELGGEEFDSDQVYLQVA